MKKRKKKNQKPPKKKKLVLSVDLKSNHKKKITFKYNENKIIIYPNTNSTQKKKHLFLKKKTILTLAYGRALHFNNNNTKNNHINFQIVATRWQNETKKPERQKNKKKTKERPETSWGWRQVWRRAAAILGQGEYRVR